MVNDIAVHSDWCFVWVMERFKKNGRLEVTGEWCRANPVDAHQAGHESSLQFVCFLWSSLIFENHYQKIPSQFGTYTLS